MTDGRSPVWRCPDCGAPFANRNASHSCVRIELDERFAGSDQAVRQAFDRLVELATVDGPIPIVVQKTRMVLAGPMRFLAVQVARHRLTGHVLAERPFAHPVVVEVVEDAYGSGLYLHRFSIASPSELDGDFAAFVREAAARVGRRQRLAGSSATVP